MALELFFLVLISLIDEDFYTMTISMVIYPVRKYNLINLRKDKNFFIEEEISHFFISFTDLKSIVENNLYRIHKLNKYHF